MQRVTLDTNIYVSALNFGGRAAQLLGMAQAGTIRIDISDPIMVELMRVLREDFAWDGYRLHFMRLKLLRIANLVSPTQTLKVVDDPDNDRIIECAIDRWPLRISRAAPLLPRIGQISLRFRPRYTGRAFNDSLVRHGAGDSAEFRSLR